MRIALHYVLTLALGFGGGCCACLWGPTRALPSVIKADRIEAGQIWVEDKKHGAKGHIVLHADSSFLGLCVMGQGGYASIVAGDDQAAVCAMPALTCHPIALVAGKDRETGSDFRCLQIFDATSEKVKLLGYDDLPGKGK